MRLSRTRRLVLGVLGVALLVSVALVGTSAARTDATTGGTLVIGRTADVDTLDPHKATAFQTVQTLGLIYGTLVQLNSKLDIVPGLATKWAFSNDSQTLTFTLRPKVKFHDGTPFTSADVAASLNRILNPATAAVARSNVADIQSITTPGTLTVVLHLNDPDVPILAALADLNTAILSSKDISSGAFTTHPNGTGPFKFESWTPKQSIKLARNSTYWANKVPLAGVQFRVIPDESSVVSALRANQIQMGLISDPVVARQVKGNGLKVLRQPALSYHTLMLDDRHPPLDKLYVRLAIQCAVDRNQVLRTAALGEGRVTGPITSPAYRSDPAARPCPTPNLTKAKQFMKASGFANGGITLHTIVETGEYATATAEAQSLQAQLEKIGINLDLQVLDAGTYVKRWLAADFDAAVALNGGRVDPDTMYNRYFTSAGNLNKVAGYSSPKLDQLFAQGRATSDVAKRKAIYTQLSKTLESQGVWVWLFTAFDYYAVTPKVHNFVPMANESLQYLRQTFLTK
jgi:peptide/nickel transport system substrate-binding protein